MVGAEIQQFLDRLDATDERAGQGAVVAYQQAAMDGLQRFDGANQHQYALATQQHQVGVDVVPAGNGVDDEFEAIGRRRHGRRIIGQQHVIGAKGARVVGLAR
ncbi:hypothetical protein D9M73_293770 [compost metagenome]